MLLEILVTLDPLDAGDELVFGIAVSGRHLGGGGVFNVLLSNSRSRLHTAFGESVGSNFASVADAFDVWPQDGRLRCVACSPSE